MGEHPDFRWWAGRSMLDFKSQEGCSFAFAWPWTALTPVVDVLIGIAQKTMPAEELALIQIILNYYPDGTSRVRSHRHRCRQVCLSLGAPRKIEVEGRMIKMHHGDCLPLFGEEHAVPPESTAGPRMSICLFYSSWAEYFSGAGVLANGSFWRVQTGIPQDGMPINTKSAVEHGRRRRALKKQMPSQMSFDCTASCNGRDVPVLMSTASGGLLMAGPMGPGHGLIAIVPSVNGAIDADGEIQNGGPEPKIVATYGPYKQLKEVGNDPWKLLEKEAEEKAEYLAKVQGYQSGFEGPPEAPRPSEVGGPNGPVQLQLASEPEGTMLDITEHQGSAASVSDEQVAADKILDLRKML
eukprot:symbB.v1.2.004843.t1/scaffold279.1/size242841/28